MLLEPLVLPEMCVTIFPSHQLFVTLHVRMGTVRFLECVAVMLHGQEVYARDVSYMSPYKYAILLLYVVISLGLFLL